MNKYFKEVHSRKHILCIYLTSWTVCLLLYSNTASLSFPATVRTHSMLLSASVYIITVQEECVNRPCNTGSYTSNKSRLYMTERLYLMKIYVLSEIIHLESVVPSRICPHVHCYSHSVCQFISVSWYHIIYGKHLFLTIIGESLPTTNKAMRNYGYTQEAVVSLSFLSTTTHAQKSSDFGHLVQQWIHSL
jgi:hypothetical protein